MKKILSVLLAVAMCFCFAGCNAINQLLNEILRWGATVPPSYAPCTTYYGVVQKQEEGDGLFVYIDGVGLCDIPTYEKNTVKVAEGDVLVIDFYTDEVAIMECYPARFALSADYMAVVEFNFSLTWGTFGISSYDSKTGKLVKTKDAPTPENYITTHILTAQEKIAIFKILQALEMDSYPDEYNPTEGIGSDPYQELILSAQLDRLTKTITAEQVALGDATSPKGQKFMDACDAIADVLENTEEWKALPDFPYLYD
ncbi:MAG: hypothetical protein IKA57_00350 [Clostridia bacterium]|nr:hypothetical protein [Clostridia bacterium]